MDNIWFTSDTHFSHRNICNKELSSWANARYRTFNSIEEMNERIINNINEVVGPQDIIYHLGDFSFGPRMEMYEIRKRIKCKRIRLVYGNHDTDIRRSKRLQGMFEWCKDYYQLKYKDIHDDNYYYHFILFHYPIASWQKQNHGSIQLHGHSHGNYKSPVLRQFDVGVDCHNFKPVSLNTILRFTALDELAAEGQLLENVGLPEPNSKQRRKVHNYTKKAKKLAQKFEEKEDENLA